MCKLLLVLGICITALGLASVGQGCAKPPTVAAFDYLKFNGTWYSIRNMPNIFESGLRCQQTTDVADVNTKGSYKVQDVGLKNDGSVVTADSTLMTPNEETPGLLENVGPGGLIRMPFYIMDTDYENYAYTYTCTGGILNIESAWILSRKRTLDEAVVERGLEIFKDANVDIEKFEENAQTDCEKLDEGR